MTDCRKARQKPGLVKGLVGAGPAVDDGEIGAWVGSDPLGPTGDEVIDRWIVDRAHFLCRVRDQIGKRHAAAGEQGPDWCGAAVPRQVGTYRDGRALLWPGVKAVRTAPKPADRCWAE